MKPISFHRPLFSLLITALACAPLQPRADDAPIATAPKDQFAFSFNDISDFLVIIEHESATGSGFVAKMDDKFYILTNQHVLFGGQNISFKTVSGKRLAPKSVELSLTRDIARLRLDTEDGLEISTSIEMNAPVGVFGNSDGAGVATALYGKINGVGAELIEVNADFVSGNSGSPVITTNQQVVGIASFVRFSEKNETSEGTRFENSTRRFCYRLSDLQWGPVNWKVYNDQFGVLYCDNEQLTYGIIDIVNTWINAPVDQIDTRNITEPKLARWVDTHNDVIKKLNQQRYTERQFYTDYSKSVKQLSSLCRARSRQIAQHGQHKALSGFLRDEFQKQESVLAYLAEMTDGIAENIYGYRD